MTRGSGGPHVQVSDVAAGRDVSVVVNSYARAPLLVLTFASGAELVLSPSPGTVIAALVIIAITMTLPRLAAAAPSAKSVTTGGFPVFKKAAVGAGMLTLGSASSGVAVASVATYVQSGGRSLYGMESWGGVTPPPPTSAASLPVTASAEMDVTFESGSVRGTARGLEGPGRYSVALYGITNSYTFLAKVALLPDADHERQGTWSASMPKDVKEVLVHLVPSDVLLNEAKDVVQHDTPPRTVLTKRIVLAP